MAAVVAGISLYTYFRTTQVNPVTGEKQRVGQITAEQEIGLGLQAAPEMAQQYGGLSQDPRLTNLVNRVGERVRNRSAASKSPYKYQFHLLEDSKTINAFALPGGQVFITRALLSKLQTDGQLAGVLGHEVGHVVGRHSAEQMAKAQLTQGLTGAAVMATYDPQDASSRGSAAVATMIGQLVSLKFGRNDELEADRMGVRFMAEAGYRPGAMIGVMEVLKQAAKGAKQPEFFSTHPNPENRTQKINQAIQELFPNGVPQNLEP